MGSTWILQWRKNLREKVEAELSNKLDIWGWELEAEITGWSILTDDIWKIKRTVEEGLV